MREATFKERYEKPQAEVLELAFEGVFCGSPIETDGETPKYNGFGNEETW